MKGLKLALKCFTIAVQIHMNWNSYLWLVELFKGELALSITTASFSTIMDNYLACLTISFYDWNMTLNSLLLMTQKAFKQKHFLPSKATKMENLKQTTRGQTSCLLLFSLSYLMTFSITLMTFFITRFMIYLPFICPKRMF